MVNVPRSLTPARPQMTQRRRITPNATPFCLPTAPDPRSFAFLDSLCEKSFILFTSPPPLFPAVLARHQGPKRTPRKHDTVTGKKVKCVRACVRERGREQAAGDPPLPPSRPHLVLHALFTLAGGASPGAFRRHLSTTLFVLRGGPPLATSRGPIFSLLFPLLREFRRKKKKMVG